MRLCTFRHFVSATFLTLSLSFAWAQTHNSDPVERYSSIDPDRKLIDQSERLKNLLAYEPTNVVKVPFAKVEAMVKNIRTQAERGNHSYCLFDTSDGCFLRNALFKRELEKSNIDMYKSSSSIIIKYADPERRWTFHSVAVIYTDKGPMVFDPDIKDADQINQGNLLTPLAIWLQVDWSHMNPAYTMAPPNYTHLVDYMNEKTVFKNAKPGKFWDNFENKTPNDPIYRDVIMPPRITDVRLNNYRSTCRATMRQSYENHKKFNPQGASR